MTKLYTLLKILSSHEINQLDVFLGSPYFTQSERLFTLFQYIRSYHPDYESIDRHQLLLQCFPNKAGDLKWLNDRYSELSKLVLRFLQVQQLTKKETLGKTVLRDALQSRGLSKLFLKETQKEIVNIQQDDTQDADSFLSLSLLYDDLYENIEAKANYDPFDQAIKADSSLEIYFLLRKLTFMSNAIGRPLTSDQQMDENWVTLLLSQAKKREGIHPLLDMYRLLVELQRGGYTQAEMENTFHFYQDQSLHFRQPDQAFLIHKLSNMAFRQIATGKTEFSYLLFDIYQYAVKEQLFHTNGFMPFNTFLNICITGAYAQQTEWVNHFIQQHKTYLKPAIRPETLAMSRAFLAFHQGDYEQAFEQLDNIHTTIPSLKIRMRSMRVRCLLERVLNIEGYYDVLQREVIAFKRFLGPYKALSAKRKQAYIHFAEATQLIANCSRQKNKGISAYQETLLQIENKAPLILKKWLLEKLETLA